jgi:hypothetical protein
MIRGRLSSAFEKAEIFVQVSGLKIEVHFRLINDREHFASKLLHDHDTGRNSNRNRFKGSEISNIMCNSSVCQEVFKTDDL